MTYTDADARRALLRRVKLPDALARIRAERVYRAPLPEQHARVLDLEEAAMRRCYEDTEDPFSAARWSRLRRGG